MERELHRISEVPNKGVEVPFRCEGQHCNSKWWQCNMYWNTGVYCCHLLVILFLTEFSFACCFSGSDITTNQQNVTANLALLRMYIHRVHCYHFTKVILTFQGLTSVFTTSQQQNVTMKSYRNCSVVVHRVHCTLRVSWALIRKLLHKILCSFIWKSWAGFLLHTLSVIVLHMEKSKVVRSGDFGGHWSDMATNPLWKFFLKKSVSIVLPGHTS